MRDADVIMMLRIQKERMAEAAIPDGEGLFRALRPRRRRASQLARPDAIVMHPQPMNRGIEIASDVADGPQSVIRDQVRNGVAVRMAVLEAVIGHRDPPAARRTMRRQAPRAHRGTIHARGRAVLAQHGIPGRAARDAHEGAAIARRARPRQLRASALRRRPADAPAAVDHARGCGGRLDRGALQGRRAGRPAALARADPGRHLERSRPDRPGFAPCPARPRVLAIGGGVGIPPMVFLAERLASRRRARDAAGADGFGDPVSVSGPSLDHHDSRHARSGDRLHAAARGMGRALAPGDAVRVRRVLRRLRHRARGGVAAAA